MRVLEESGLPFPLLRRGKVRELYEVGGRVLLVASDRISAFDCVLSPPVPGKGAVLTQMSAYWFGRTGHRVRNHLLSAEPEEIVRLEPGLADSRDVWEGRAMLVRRAEPLAVECVVRGFLAGSAWREYEASGTLAGEPLPEGLAEASELPEPIFSPATKAETGHDENITYAGLEGIVGRKVAALLRDTSLLLYDFAAAQARAKGIVIADTKFEFGVAESGEILLIDEALTPDSSRFWPADGLASGRPPESLDKQPVRDYLEGLVREGAWNREPPAPALPGRVVEATTNRYLDAFTRITGLVRPLGWDEDA
ncbi:MAG: phosphoribosylaminoimidazolesuccinocarboxamide synthase [Gemmatimonadota bacterium]